MKAFNLTKRTNSVKSLFKMRGMHNIDVVEAISNRDNDIYYPHMPACSKQAEAEGYGILVVSQEQWDLCSYSLEKNFKGSIYLVGRNGKLLHVAANRRDTRSASERQADQNLFVFKQHESALNSLNDDIDLDLF
jgi:hypothetical protein